MVRLSIIIAASFTLCVRGYCDEAIRCLHVNIVMVSKVQPPCIVRSVYSLTPCKSCDSVAYTYMVIGQGI